MYSGCSSARSSPEGAPTIAGPSRLPMALLPTTHTRGISNRLSKSADIQSSPSSEKSKREFITGLNGSFPDAEDLNTRFLASDSQPGQRSQMGRGEGHSAAPGGEGRAASRSFVNGPSSSSLRRPAQVSSQGAVDESIMKVRRSLPVWSAREAIVKKIEEEETVILMADTGSGKSTQVPQFLHEAGFTSSSDGKESLRMIGITQPRRMAALSLAKRVAQELGTSDPGDDRGVSRSGSIVGFAIRFQDRTTKDTRIKFMTDGWLLREFVKASASLTKGEVSLDQIQDPHHEALLPHYSVLIIDEAHERTVRSDLLLGLAKRIQRRRRELRRSWEQRRSRGQLKEPEHEPELLRMVIMSATIDAELFSNFFATGKSGSIKEDSGATIAIPEEAESEFVPAPVLYVKGRTHPVTLHHLRQPVEDWVDAAKRQVLQLHVSRACGSSDGIDVAGDILVFGTGAEEIESLAAGLRQLSEYLPIWASDQERITGKPQSLAKLLVVPLYAALGSKAVAQVYKPTPPGYRKVVVATNIAETSVTIPGIRYVIDCGLAKERMHISDLGRGAALRSTSKDAHKFLSSDSISDSGVDTSISSTGIETLTTRAISRSAAMQRSGRAGREAPGECYRLYQSSAFGVMEQTTLPEIHRTNLGSVALDCFSAGVDPREIEWVEAPHEAKLMNAVLALATMEALDPAPSSDGKTTKLVLTPLGRKMSLLPLAPQFSLLLLTAAEHYSEQTTRQARDLVAILSSERSIFVDATMSVSNKADQKRSDGNGALQGDMDRMREELELLDLKRAEADKAKRVFRHRSGDHVTMLRALYRYLKVKKEFYAEGSRSKGKNGHQRGGANGPSPEARLKVWCAKHFINLRSMKEIEDVREQLVGICQRAGIRVQEEEDKVDGGDGGSSSPPMAMATRPSKKRKRMPSALQNSASSTSSDSSCQEDEPINATDVGTGSGDRDYALTVTKGPRHNHNEGEDDDVDADTDADEEYDSLLQCLVKGRVASNVAARIDEGEHKGHFRRILGHEIFRLHPSSALSSRNIQHSSSSNASISGGGARGSAPKYILFEELQYTASLYARCVSEVKIEWLGEAAGKGS